MRFVLSLMGLAALMIAAPAFAYTAKPTVPAAGVDTVGLREFTALHDTYFRSVSDRYYRLAPEARRPYAAKFDELTTELADAQQAQRNNNRAAFEEASAKVRSLSAEVTAALDSGGR